MFSSVFALSAEPRALASDQEETELDFYLRSCLRDYLRGDLAVFKDWTNV